MSDNRSIPDQDLTSESGAGYGDQGELGQGGDRQMDEDRLKKVGGRQESERRADAEEADADEGTIGAGVRDRSATDQETDRASDYRPVGGTNTTGNV